MIADEKYVLGELLGKGNYGRVYVARKGKEEIAVKQVEIPKTGADRANEEQASAVEALLREVVILQDLAHPNIVQYLGFRAEPDFLIM